MHISAILTSSFAASSVLALGPSAGIKRQSPIQGTTVWTNPNNGTTQLVWSDTALQFGDRNPLDIIKYNVTAACTSGGSCLNDSDDIPVPNANVISEGTVEQLDISYRIVGVYPNGTASINALINALGWAVGNQTNSTTNVCGVDPNSIGPCPGSPNDGDMCPTKELCYTQYTAPSSVEATIPIGENEDAASITVTFTTKMEGGTGLCSLMTTLGEAISAFVPELSGVLGLGFTLASLGCSS